MLCDLATSALTFTVQTLTGQLASIHDRLLIWNIWSYFYCDEWSLNDTPLKYQRGILYGTKFWIGNWFLLAVMFEWLPKCWCKKSMSRVWVEELSDTRAICYLLSPTICHPPRSPIILIKIVRYTLVWTVDTYRDTRARVQCLQNSRDPSRRRSR